MKKKYTYIIFTLSPDSTEIVVDKAVKQEDYDEFIKDLPETECRWAIYDFGFQKEDGSLRNKITFLSW